MEEGGWNVEECSIRAYQTLIKQPERRNKREEKRCGTEIQNEMEIGTIMVARFVRISRRIEIIFTLCGQRRMIDRACRWMESQVCSHLVSYRAKERKSRCASRRDNS